MKTFEFAIIGSGLDPTAEDFEARIYNAGCDDATVSFQKGHIIVDFAREAESIDDAIASAVKDVRAAGVTVDRIEPDPLVSLSDIAKRANLTRGAITNYAKGDRGANFPAPVARITSEQSLWSWGSVARWLLLHGKVTRSVAVEAVAFERANELVRHDQGGDIRKRLKDEVEACQRAI